MADNVELEIPLSTRFASTVRAVAAAVSADLGFSVDEIDDLRLAVNEAVSLLADVDVLARRILEAVVDEYSVVDGTFTVVKRLAALAS